MSAAPIPRHVLPVLVFAQFAGTSLTQLAQLPPHSERALSDPYAEKQTPWKAYGLVLAVLLLAVFGWYLRAHLQ